MSPDSTTGSAPPPAAPVTAVLGPTNTGKTWLAMDRMLGHASGMIGFPLRLLARENYDRVVRAKGEHAVALITGEEKIVPANPRYFVCTVESMPVDRRVAFLAVDEIQLAADPDRGHVFTDRLLNARGEIETMFLGAETAKPVIRRLVPGVQFVQRPRFSKLSYTGAKKLTRLPRRSAVVAFSVSEVYGIAELIRRHRGGTAVVMGALSPRTRNAQVALYQGGEVDYLVATDAIGMGLNMDVDHVGFAATGKFDGHRMRPLVAPEVAQIAGRAGRHMNDGTFGVTAEVSGLDPDIVIRVENHEFPALSFLYWRNTDLRFISPETLLADLKAPPPHPALARPPPAEDQLVLEAMLREGEVRSRLTGRDRLRLLWDVAQVPDFRKLKPEQHARLMAQVYQHLTQSDERLPDDFLAAQVARIDRTDGDIHTLMDRIAAIRTWTYVSHRPDWVPTARAWQERTRAIEDKLSDALHTKLTQQFVDRRTSHLVKRLKADDLMHADVDGDGGVTVDGHKLGRLQGLRFAPERTGLRAADRAVLNAANAALRPVVAARVEAICASGDEAFSLDDGARIAWRGEAIARLMPGAAMLRPQVEIPADERLEAAPRLKVEARLRDWLANHVAQVLGPLVKAQAAADAGAIAGPVRGIVFQLAEGLGAVRRNAVDRQLEALSDADRKAMARFGIRFGLDSVYVPALLKAAPVRLRGLLWIAAHRDLDPPALPASGRVSLPVAANIPAAFMLACGYRVIAGAGYRIDMLERFAAEARKLARDGAKILPPAQLSLLGIGVEAAPAVLAELGFTASLADGGLSFGFDRRSARRAARQTRTARAAPAAKVSPDSPFARLKQLVG
ncbi:MAG: helicase-related protein [Rhodospirillaceae bacterium]|nr:helicase-related protein [Rhodospirillaceae bacterium]